MTDREDNALGLALCMMALGGLNGGGNMGQNMNWAAMQNAVQANQSALYAMQMQQNSRMANCQTVNPLCRAMEPVKKCWDCAHCSRLTGWCDLFDDYAVKQKTEWKFAGCKWWKSKSGGPDGPEKKHETCKHFDQETKWCTLFEQYAKNAEPYCGKHAYWVPIQKADEELKRCCCETQKRPVEQIKTCATCKNRDIGSFTLCAKLRTSNLAAKCVFGGYPYWEPKEPRQMETQAMLEDIDLVKQQLKYKIEELQNRVEVCKVPRFTPVPKDVFAELCGEPYKPPEQKRLTLDDLYNLAFPVDPIRDYFEGVCEQIDAAHEKRMEILDRVEFAPVERVEIVEELDKPKSWREIAREWARMQRGLIVLCGVTAGVFNRLGYISFFEMIILAVEAGLMISAISATMAVLERQ